MHENWEIFAAALRGELPPRVPLTSTWGGHGPHKRKVLGRQPAGDADQVAYRLKVGFPIGLRIGRGHPFGSASQIASDGTQHYVQGHLKPGSPLKQYEDHEDLADFAASVREKVRISHAAGLGAEGCVTSCIHALSIALGLEGLAIAAFDYADWLDEAMELVEARNQRSIAAMIDAGVDIVLFDGDCAYKSGLMLSPRMMRRFWFERTRRSVALLREAGVWAYYHTDGNVYELLDMLIELGFAAFHGCEKAANDLAYLKTTFGERITLIGNADLNELTTFTPEQVVVETQQMLRTAAPGGRYVADVNTSIHDFAPIENYEAFLQTVRREGVYKPDGTLAV